MAEGELKQRKVLLAVLAHPDDETFGMGGTLALYAHRGVDVYLVCATLGEVGVMEPEYLEGFDSPAQRRESELQCAAQKLGIKRVFFLGYRDSGMPGSEDNHHPRALAAAPLEEVVKKVVHYIRLLQPQVVITFDPVGGYRHPDHIRIHDATVEAFSAAGHPDRFRQDDLPPYRPKKLYFHTFSRKLLRLAVWALPLLGKDPHRWGTNRDIDLADLAVDDFPVHAIINYKEVRQVKDEAAECHASQGGGAMLKGMLGLVLRMAGARESFIRAEPPPAPGTPKERDLFMGV
jgi:LmbE family N-acetylglucosaminyl deacetylase